MPNKSENMTVDVINRVEDALRKIVFLNGDIKRISEYGHSIVIHFENGNVYRQSLISRDTSRVVLDSGA